MRWLMQPFRFAENEAKGVHYGALPLLLPCGMIAASKNQGRRECGPNQGAFIT
jgi:hypothetical protein